MEHEVVVPTVYPEHITSKSFIIHLLRSQREKIKKKHFKSKTAIFYQNRRFGKSWFRKKNFVEPFVFQTDDFFEFLL